MSEQDGLSPAERELETALRSLAPAAVRLDPLAAAFEAGRRFSRRQLRLWQSATAAVLMISVTTWFVPVRQPLVIRQSNVALAPNRSADPAERPTSEQSLLTMREAVWEKGVDGLPTLKLPPATSRRNSATFINGDES